MNLENLRERWVKALRSGKYEQGRGSLSDRLGNERGERNCCLGVVCRIARAPRSQWQDQGVLTDFDAGAELMDALGLTCAEQSQLTHLNDQVKLPFEEIADLIEEDRIEDVLDEPPYTAEPVH